MRKKLLACLIAAAASLGTGGVFADDTADAVVEVAPVTEVEAISETDSSGTEESTPIHVYLPPEDSGDGSTPEVVVDPVPVDETGSEELPTYDVVDGETPTLYTDPAVDEEQPVVDEETLVDAEPVIDEEPVAVDAEKPVTDEDLAAAEDATGDETPVAEEGTAFEGGGSAELVTTTSSGSEEDSLIYTTTTSTRGPEGCMECRNLTGVAEELPLDAAAPEVTADVIDDNAMPAQAERAKRRNAAQ